MKRYRVAGLAAGLSLACATAQAAQLQAPQEISLGGKTYRQVYTNANAQQAIWEYTTDGEKVEDWQWTRLVTINHLKIGDVPLSRWLDVVKQMLDRTQPPPRYRIEPDGQGVQVRIVYQPNPANPRTDTYEANVWIARPVAACGGIVNLQFARQHPARPGDDVNQTMDRIERENAADMAALQKLDWRPVCK